MLKKLALSIFVIALMMNLSYVAFGKWERSRVDDLEGHLRSICFIDENKGWAAGDGGTVVFTSDGGAKWDQAVVEEVKEADIYKDLWDVCFIDENTGWISGDTLKGSGIILHTKDGGKRWDRQNSGVAVPLYGIFFFDNKNGWAIGANSTILGTQSSGSKWNPLYTGRASGGGEAVGEGEPGLWDLFFISLQKGWVVGENGTIRTTADGGKTWTNQTSGTDSNLSAVDFVDENTGWVVGDSGTILNTIDGGKTWTAQKSGVTEWLYGVDFVSEKEGVASGEYGTILHTTDGGNTWKIDVSAKQKGTKNVIFFDVSFRKPSAAYAVGEWGLILKYTP